MSPFILMTIFYSCQIVSVQFDGLTAGEWR
jgi:hypothetical protein